MSDTVFKFGAGKACTSIEVAPFTPICSKPAVPGSEALTLEVPAPAFAPVMPPQECACFAFTPQPGTINVTMRKRSDITEAKPLQKEMSIAVAATGDCCNGAYTVTPTIKIDVPECVTADHVIYSNTTEIGYGGSITCTLGIRDCVPYFELSSKPVSITLPNIPNLCLGETTIEVKATYIDAGGTEQTATSGSVTVSSSVDSNNCQKYSFDAITLDLTDLPTGGFGNGGSVFKASNDNNLYLDGTIDENDDVWYGGGLGNLLADDPDAVLCRGPKMRGYSTVEGLSTTANSPVQNITKSFKLLKNDGTTEATAWHSSRKATTTAGGVTTTTVDNGTITVDGKRGQTGLQYVGGNLSVVLPSGFQWHEKGLALNLSHFFWEKSGLLSVMEETGMAALVSPAPAYHKPGTTYAGHNASGLAVFAAGDVDHGLSVKFGEGLRIFGASNRTDSSELADIETSAATQARMGRLEVMYGPGFRIRGADSGGSPTYRNVPRDIDGALVPNDGRGLRVHGVTKKKAQWSETQGSAGPGDESYPDTDVQVNKLEVHAFDRDITFQSDGRLVLNDTYTGREQKALQYDNYGNDVVHAWRRGGTCYTTRYGNYTALSNNDYEYTLPVLVPQVYLSSPKDAEPGDYVEGNYADDPSGAIRPALPGSLGNGFNETALNTLKKTVGGLVSMLGTLTVMYIHVTRSGLLLGIDTKPYATSSTQHWTPVRLADK